MLVLWLIYAGEFIEKSSVNSWNRAFYWESGKEGTWQVCIDLDLLQVCSINKLTSYGNAVIQVFCIFILVGWFFALIVKYTA